MAARQFSIRLIAIVVMLGLVAVCGMAQSPKPISKSGLIEALKLGGLTQSELVGFVQKRGVDFQLTADVEQELRGAGAAAELLQAAKANYRGAAAQEAPAAPGALQQPVLAGPFGAAPPASPGTPAAPAAQPGVPAAAGAPVTPSVKSLVEVKKIFIEKMPNDLDQYLRAEITKQLGGRMVVVLVREDADAIMTGVGEHKTGTGAVVTGRYLGLHDNATGAVSMVDRSGTVVLWSSEAGDRSLLMGAVKRGGPRKVADRLIHNLKKAMGY